MDLAARNKALIERMHADLLATRDPRRVAHYFSPSFRSHNLPPGFPEGPAGAQRFFASFVDALRDISVNTDVILAEADLVAVRTTTRGIHRGPLLGIPGTGRRLEIDGTDVVRIEDGRIAEHWGLTNTVGVLEQVGTLARLRWLVRLLVGRRQR